jgi:hypothetical protein
VFSRFRWKNLSRTGSATKWVYFTGLGFFVHSGLETAFLQLCWVPGGESVFEIGLLRNAWLNSCLFSGVPSQCQNLAGTDTRVPQILEGWVHSTQVKELCRSYDFNFWKKSILKHS